MRQKSDSQPTLALKYLVLMFFCLTFARSVVLGASDLDYTANGVLLYTNYLSKQTFDINYEFSVRGVQWIIKANQFGVRQFGYTEHGFNGQDLYSITYYNKDPIEIERTNRALTYFVNGTVKPAFFPPFDPVRSIHIWYAHFGFFNPPVDGSSQIGCRLLSGLDIKNCFRSIICKTNGSLSDEGPIITCEVKDDGYDYNADGTPRKLAPPFDKGYTAMHYWVYSMTNTPGGIIPLKYSYTAYLYAQDAHTTNDTVALWSLEGNITDFKSKCVLNDFKPKIIDPTYVWDYVSARQPNVDHIEYFTKFGWGAADIPNAIKVGPADRYISLKRTTIIAFFCISFVLLLFFVFKTKKTS